MKLIVAGPRDHYPDDSDFDRAFTRVAYEANLDVSQVVTAWMSGVGACAFQYAIRGKIPCLRFEEDQKKFGESAAAIRDSRMLDHGDALLVFSRQWLRTRRGRALLEMAEKRGMPVYIEEVEG